MTHASLFSGIGGFDLAAEWMGWENIFHCEWNPFGQRVLAHHFPNSKSYNDITKTDFTIHAGKIDVLSGGFPCQPYSSTGKRLGKKDERHLWPEMLRTVKEVKPTWVVGENVLGIVTWGGGMVFNEVQVDLENQGYEVQAYILPASGKNAPHKRERTWFIAHSKCIGQILRNNKEKQKIQPRYGFESLHSFSEWKTISIKSAICGADDGLPKELDNITFSNWRSESIKAYGNAIVPQVAYEIFKAIQSFEDIVK